MKADSALLREQVQSALGPRCEAAFLTEKKDSGDPFPSMAGEIPRGALTEIAGPASSGRASLLYSLLATASSGQEFCAFLDVQDTFDPESADAAGVRLSQVLWVRCAGNIEHAMKAADMLASGGGFALVAIDFADTPAKAVQRIPLAMWFRLRRAVENTKTALVAVAQQIHTQSCAALKIELSRGRALWRSQMPACHAWCLLDGLEATAKTVRSHRMQQRSFVISR
jgi:hypothetical protein